MARPYRIRDGAAFVRSDGTRATGGQLIELEDDVAQAHADKLEHLSVPEAGEDSEVLDLGHDGPSS